MRLFGLIGYPLGHSFSASFFKEKFEKEGLDDRYQNFPIESVDLFEELVKSYPELKGINVTIPYKETIIPYLDALSKTARAVKAVNTICFCKKTGRLGLIGHNTDVIGFEKSLNEHLTTIPEKALVLGTGGSSRAVMYVLSEMNIHITHVSRKRTDGKITYSDLDAKMVSEHHIIVNTTPLGMHPDTDTAPDIPYDGIGEKHLVFDLVYNPPATKFLQLAKSKGANIVNGQDMLVYQAEASWDIWNRNASETLDF